MTKAQFNLTNGTSEWNDDLANITEVQVIDSSFVNGGGTGVINFRDLPVTIERNHYFRTAPTSTIYGPATALKKIKDCLFYGGGISGWFRNSNGLVENNYFYNNQNQAFGNGGLSSAIFRNNYIWGCGTAGSFRNDGPMVDVLFENNVWNYTLWAIYNFSVMIDVVFRNETFGNEKALNYIFGSFAGYSPFSKVLFENCNYGTLSNTQTYADKDGVDGSQVRFQNWDGTNNDATFMPYGSITRTGTGLSDTTVRTAGGFAMRFEPTYSPNLMHWEQIIPTGNIQSKTMTVSLWVKINNSAYWAGTHTKPTLTVDYDNGTEISSVATATAGSWQQLAVTFTPTTGYGQIEMKVTGATDATGTNRYFYVDDVNVAYPAGVQVDLGGLDLWAEGLPVAPAIATMPSLAGVWDEPLSAHTIAGSAGKILKDANDSAELASIK